MRWRGLDEHARNEINFIKDEIRNIKIDYIKKDDLDYRNIKEKTERNAEELAEMRATVKNTNILLEKNNTLTENLNVSNTRLTTILENLAEMTKETKTDVKGLTVKINKIDNETSKNTDNRLTTKQVVVSLIISILMLLIGAGLAQSGMQ